MIENLYNAQGFYWFFGVVENRNDPLKAGRCQIRIFGDHTANKEELPTKDLPWAIPMMPITSASISGKGTSPLGPIEGTWVVGWYLDGPDKQIPMMIGTIAASSIPNEITQTQTKERPTLTNPTEEETKTNIEKNPNVPVPARKPVTGWSLGKTSEEFESGKRGPGVINEYNGKASGDLGGASYGLYQLASNLPPVMPSGKMRKSAASSTLVSYIRQSRFKNKLLGLKPATPEFDAVWKQIAKEYPEEFREDQHEFIKKTHYDVMLSNLKRCGLDLSGYGPSVQDLIWSTAVHIGPGATSVFVEPLKGKSNLSEADIVSLVSEFKRNNVHKYFKSSDAKLQASLSNRFVKEKDKLLKLIT